MERDYESIIKSLRSLEVGGLRLEEELKRGDKISTKPSNKPRNNFNNNLSNPSAADSELSHTASDIIKKLTSLRIDSSTKENAENSLLDNQNIRAQSQSQSQLPLHQQEAMASELIQDIMKFNRAKTSSIEEQIPAHLANFKTIYEAMKEKNKKQSSGEEIQLPIIKILKPEEQRKVKLMPPPSEGEKKIMKKIDEKFQKMKSTDIYDFILEKSKNESDIAKLTHAEEPMIQLVENQSIICSKVDSKVDSKVNSFSVMIASKQESLFELSAKYNKRIKTRTEALNTIFGENNESVRTDDSVSGSYITKSTLTSIPLGPKTLDTKTSNNICSNNNPKGSDVDMSGNNNSYLSNFNKKLSPEDYPFNTELKQYLSQIHRGNEKKSTKNVIHVSVNNGKKADLKDLKPQLLSSNVEPAARNPLNPYNQMMTYIRSDTSQKSKVEKPKEGLVKIRRKSIGDARSLAPNNPDYLGLFTPIEYESFLESSNSSIGMNTIQYSVEVVGVGSGSIEAGRPQSSDQGESLCTPATDNNLSPSERNGLSNSNSLTSSLDIEIDIKSSKTGDIYNNGGSKENSPSFNKSPKRIMNKILKYQDQSPIRQSKSSQSPVRKNRVNSPVQNGVLVFQSTPKKSEFTDAADLDPVVIEYMPLIETTLIKTNEIITSHKSVLAGYRRALNDYKRLGHEHFMDGVKTSLYEEMGIDVDPLYTKGRLYGKAVTFLLYYVYSITLRETMSHWKIQVEKINEVRRRKAFFLLNRVARGMLARMRLKEKMNNLRLQKLAEIERRKKEKAEKRWATFIISRKLNIWCRRKVNSIRKTKMKAVTTIQRRVRGISGRVKAAKAKKIRDYKASFALKIQCAYRQRLSRRRVVLYRKLRYVRLFLHAVSTKQKEIELYNRRTGAAWKIIKCFRMYFLCKKKVARIMYWKRIRQITHIQASIRRFVSGRKVGRLLVVQRKIDGIRRKAVVTIQAIVRRKLAYNRYNEAQYRKHLQRRERLSRKAKIEKSTRLRVKYHRVVHFMRYWSLSCGRNIEQDEKAIVIQKIFRGHRGKNNFIRCKIIKLFKNIKEIHNKKNEAAVLIQKTYRGFISRLANFKKKKQKLALKIQCAYRQWRAKCKMKLIRRNKLALDRVNKMLLRYIFVRRRFKDKMYMKKYGKYLLTLQRWARHSLGRKFFNNLKATRRYEKEIHDTVTMRINKFIAGMQLKLIQESINRSISVRPKLFSSNSCICNGPIQAMFVNEAAKNGMADEETLSLNRADALNLQKFAKLVEGMTIDGKSDGEITFNFFTKPKRPKKEKNSDANQSKPGTPGGHKTNTINKKNEKNMDSKDKKKKKGKKSMTSIESTKRPLPYSLLFDYLKNGSILLHKFPKKLEAVEIDLAFNAVKLEGEVSLLFTEFIEFIQKCSLLCNGAVLEKSGRDQPSSNVIIRRRTINTGIEFKDAEVESVETIDTTDHNVQENFALDDKVVKENHEKVNLKQKNSMAKGSKTQEKINLKDDQKFNKMMDSMIYTCNSVVNDIQLSFFLKALMSFLKEDWMIDIINYLETESRQKLGSFVTRIQCMARKKRAYQIYAMKLKENQERLEQALIAGKIIKFQTMFRRVLGRKRAAKQAQRSLIHYIPFEGLGYWYNHSTKVSQYHKPKILGSNDCVTVPLPPLGMEYVVKCSNCTTPAKFNCLECEDSFCKQCFSNLHSKGTRTKHKTAHIFMCPYCKCQMVTKHCESCTVKKPKPGSIQELLVESQRGLFCDSCFTHTHDGQEHYLEKNLQLKKASRTLLSATKDAYLVGHEMKRKLITEHKFEHVIQPCEECKWRAAAWRCNVCVQIYCNYCLLGLHSLGGPFSKHHAEKLPYFTCEMSQSYDKDYYKQIFNKKITTLARSEAKKREEKFFRSLLKVQTWWRMHYWGNIGSKLVKQNRRKLRKSALAYKKETETVRNTFDYKLSQFFGDAPVLMTDNRRDFVLRNISSIFHKFADHFILRNSSDMQNRKGKPKNGYDVGTIAELTEQANYGGFRLKGTHFVSFGRSTVTTSCSIEDVVNIGEIIRIRTQFFRVVKCNKTRLTLSRKWRGNNEGGLIIYKMPSYGNEEYSMLFGFKYWLYDALIVKNCFATSYLKLHSNAHTKLSNVAVIMMKKSAEEDDLKTALQWRAKSIKWYKKSLWSTNFIGGEEPQDVDLSKAINPDEVKRQKEIEEKEKEHAETVAKKAKQAKKIAKKVENEMLQAALGEDSTFLPPETLISSVEEDSTIVISSKDDDRDDKDDTISVLTTDTKQFEKEQAAAASTSSPTNKLNPINESGSVGSGSNHSKFSKLTPKPKGPNRPPGVDWYATREEVEWRKSREFLMTKEELAAEAHEWEECMDPLTEVIFYRHIATYEIMASIPKSLQCFRDIKEEKDRNIKNFVDANAKIKKMAQAKESRKLLNGTVANAGRIRK